MLQAIPDAASTRWRVVAVVAAIASSIAIVSTYRVFSNMYDEPAHLAAGMEWLSRGTFTLEPQHPPVSRVASALLPWLAGETSHGNTHMFSEGRAILGRGAHYERMLALARLGQMPFYLLLLLVTWSWGRRVAGERAAAVAVVLAAANPSVLGHAGVAGTDIGPAALMPAALFVWAAWLGEPTAVRSMGLGAVAALCGLTKFSAAAYWVAGATGVALLYAMRYPQRVLWLASSRRLFRPFLIAFASGCLVTWAAYRFSVGAVGGLMLPAPELWIGLRDFVRHGTGGHPAFLFGDVRLDGWWYYDLVAVLLKTPVPLLVFGAVGAVLTARTLRRSKTNDPVAPVDNAAEFFAAATLVGASAVLVVASLARVDLGVRLDLPLYPMLSVLGAVGVDRWLRLARRRTSRVVLALLCTWTVVTPIVAHPDYVAWFNVLAGRHPERILVDSNLDWGQDLYRLRDAVAANRMDSLRIHYFGTAELLAVGLERTRRLRPDERSAGWVAASETFYAGVWSDTSLNWLHAYEPVKRIGKSIRLYFIPAVNGQR